MAAFTVTHLNDSGAGSHRQALVDTQAAVGADSVTFAAGIGSARTGSAL